MSIITTSGFAALLRDVADRSRQAPNAAEAFRIAAGIDGRVAEELYSQALSVEEAEMLLQFEVTGAVIDSSGVAAGPVVRLNRYGRAFIAEHGAPAADDDLTIGTVQWPHGRAPKPSERLIKERAELARDDEAIADWLAAKPLDEVRGMLADLSDDLQRLGPVILYCDGAYFTNIGKTGNLVGRSIAADSDRCTLHQLSSLPPQQWTVAQRRFVTCMYILRKSGTTSRTGELNGTQISLQRLREFLRDRLSSYGAGDLPALSGADRVDEVVQLARYCADARASVVQRGGVPWREVNALVFNKKEYIDWSGSAGIAYPSVSEVTERYSLDQSDIETFTRSVESRMDDLMNTVPDPGEPAMSAFDTLIRDLMGAAVTDSGSDAAMSRGPRDIAALARHVQEDSAEPVGWTTNAYYCCVVPSQRMIARFTGEPAQLPPALKAMSARMRWNCWHFMPHAIGKHESVPGRDWFFSPVIPDHTAWSDQHHQGHVANGVRHAIRVPIACRFGERHLPGIYDLRLMRVDGLPYSAADLKAARDFTAYLAVLYQVRAERLADRAPGTHAVTAFDNKWFDRAYGRQLVLEQG